MVAADSKTLAFDSSVLSCFARANHLDLLRDLTEGHPRVLTRAVKEEIDNGIPKFPLLGKVQECGWLEVVRADSLDEMFAFSHYVSILGCGNRNIGEATILAWAEVNNAIAILDDQAGINEGKKRGVQIKRTLALVSSGVQRFTLSEDDAAGLVDDLISGGARFPCDGRRFMKWCRDNGLLT